MPISYRGKWPSPPSRWPSSRLARRLGRMSLSAPSGKIDCSELRSLSTTPLWGVRASRLGAAYFVVVRRRRACLLTPPQHGGARFPTLTPLGGNLGLLERRRGRVHYLDIESVTPKGQHPRNLSGNQDRAC